MSEPLETLELDTQSMINRGESCRSLANLEPVCAGQRVTMGDVDQEPDGVKTHASTDGSPAPGDHENGCGQEFFSCNQDYARLKIRDAWLASKRRPNTRIAYRYDLESYFQWCDARGIDVLTAEQEQLDEYANDLDTFGYRPATQHRKLSAVSSYYRHGVRRFKKLVPANPMADVERPDVADESTTEALDVAEAKRLLAAAREVGGRDSAIVHLLAHTGMRVSELCGASVADLRTERGHRTVQVERKGGKYQRLVISGPAVEALDSYLAGRKDGPLFIGKPPDVPVTRYYVARALQPLLKAARIDKRITPHSLRHTAATLALDAGVDIREVQRMLGHSSIETTMRYDRSISRVDKSPAHVLAEVLG